MGYLGGGAGLTIDRGLSMVTVGDWRSGAGNIIIASFEGMGAKFRQKRQQVTAQASALGAAWKARLSPRCVRVCELQTRQAFCVSAGVSGVQESRR